MKLLTLRPWSIRKKLFRAIVALTLCVVLPLGVYFPAEQAATAREGLEQKATRYASLVEREVEPAIAFDDRQTAREVFDAMTTDTDVQAMALYVADGGALHATGELSREPVKRLSAGDGPLVETIGSVVRCTVPVVAKEGPRGTLVIELSTRSIDAQRARAWLLALVVGLAALAVGLLGAWTLSRALGRRIHAIAAVAPGNLDAPFIEDGADDELGQLGRSFREMVGKIAGLMGHIEASAAREQGRLQQLVAERTSELDGRNAAMRLVLDHVGEGFLTLDRDGRVDRERSAIVERFLGPVDEGRPFWDCLGAIDPEAGAWFDLGFHAIREDVLPLELSLLQMPSRFRKGALVFALRYTPIMVDGAPDRLLVVIRDVTSEVERERAEQAEGDLLRVFDRAIKDRAGLCELIEEGSSLVASVRDGAGELPTRLRALHTLKGNSALFGLTRIARLCHDIETRAIELGGIPLEADVIELSSEWQRLAGVVGAMIAAPARTSREVEAHEVVRLREAIATGSSRAELLALVAAFELEPASRRLSRLAEHARVLADRLGKAELDVLVEANGVLLDPERDRTIGAALVHAVRNAIDHGIESPAERTAAGKRSRGSLVLRASSDGADALIEIIDDGRGIDWDSVATRARAAGLPGATPAQLEEALFHDGLSTRASATELSGRGLGLGAVRDVCSAIGGSLSICSERGVGTTVTVRMPRAGGRDVASTAVKSAA